MKLDDRTGVLVAIGSAAAVNCHDCLRHLAERATALEVGAQEVAAAVKIGLRVNRAAGDNRTLASNACRAAGANRPSEHELAGIGERASTSGDGCCTPPAERGA